MPAQPSLAWLRALQDRLAYEETLWAQTVKARQNSVRKTAMDEDWAAGGSIHAARICRSQSALL